MNCCENQIFSTLPSMGKTCKFMTMEKKRSTVHGWFPKKTTKRGNSIECLTVDVFHKIKIISFDYPC